MARTPGGRILTCLRTLEGCLFFPFAPLIHAKDRGHWRTVGRVKLVNIAPREVVCARAPLYCVRILTKVLIEGVSCLFLCCRLPPGLFGKHGVQCSARRFPLPFSSPFPLPFPFSFPFPLRLPWVFGTPPPVILWSRPGCFDSTFWSLTSP